LIHAPDSPIGPENNFMNRFMSVKVVSAVTIEYGTILERPLQHSDFLAV